MKIITVKGYDVAKDFDLLEAQNAAMIEVTKRMIAKKPAKPALKASRRSDCP